MESVKPVNKNKHKRQDFGSRVILGYLNDMKGEVVRGREIIKVSHTWTFCF